MDEASKDAEVKHADDTGKSGRASGSLCAAMLRVALGFYYVRNACSPGCRHLPFATWWKRVGRDGLGSGCSSDARVVTYHDSIRYVAVAAFTLWRDTFDHGWVMPFLTAGTAISCLRVEDFVAARSPRHVRVGWRAGGAPHVDDVPDSQLDLSYDLFGWYFLCRNDAWSCLQHLVPLAGTLIFWHSLAAWSLQDRTQSRRQTTLHQTRCQASWAFS